MIGHRRKGHGIMRGVKLLIIVLLSLCIFLLSAFLIWASTIEIPDFSLFENRRVAQSTKLFDRTGEILLYDVHKDVRRTVIPFTEISDDIKHAAIAIEDDQFYEHYGIKPKAILRATLVNLGLREGYQGQGGSTITQQVIKNALLSNEKTITRKVKEWILAVKLERVLSKDEILHLYLNEAPYGGNIYGVEEASRTYFGKSAQEVSLAEAAYLAALPQSPTRYSPYGNHTELLDARKNLVLSRMETLGMITGEEKVFAQETEVHFIPRQEQGMRAPHFVMYLKEQLVEHFGEELLTEGGLRIVTTIDMELQSKTEALVKQYAETNAKQFNATNAGVVVMDPKTGNILAMVGSKDYFDVDADGNFNIALAKRQPGSAFKPFVYAAGLELGYTPDTVLFDVPTEFSTRCDTEGKPLGGETGEDLCYMPENYDLAYRGPMSLRDALAQSVNVPAVKMLYLVGLDKAIDIAERLGITTLGPKERYGLTLVLGGGEVSLLEMTGAYGVFAHDGMRAPINGVLRIESPDKSVLSYMATSSTQVIDPEVARKMSDMLSDNIARTPAFGSDSHLHIPDHDVAVKTGTTNDYRDAWIVGYSSSVVVGAWAGNNDNTPMEKKVAGFIIAPLWKEVMTEALALYPSEQFPSPQPIPQNIKPALRGVWYGGNTYKVDKISGMLATEFTPHDLIVERVIPNPHEILYWIDKHDPTGAQPQNPYEDPQFLLWETPAQKWIAEHGMPSSAFALVPSGFDTLHHPESRPKITLLSPTTTQTYARTEKIVVRPEISTTFQVERVDVFLGNTYLGATMNAPYLFAFVPSELSDIRADNELRILVTDIVGNKEEISMVLHITP
jgi:1A family penicillin-binding protein